MNAGVDRQRVLASIMMLVHKRRQRVVDPLPAASSTRLQDLGISSLELIELIFDVEECFGITFADSDAGRMAGATLQDLLDLTCMRLQQGSAPRSPD